MAAAALAGVALLGVAAYVALVTAYPPQRLAALLSQEVTRATGRSFAILGDLSIRLLPSLAVVAQDLRLGNAAWGSRPDMVSLRKAAFVVALKPWLLGRVRILSISAEGADLLLETRSDGRGNWVFDTPPAEPADASAAGPPVALDMLAATGAVVSYRDGATGVTRTLAVKSLEVEAAGESSQLQADITLDGQRLQVGGQSGRFEALAAARAAWPFDLQVQTDGATLTAKGELGAVKPPLGSVAESLCSRAWLLTKPWSCSQRENASRLPRSGSTTQTSQRDGPEPDYFLFSRIDIVAFGPPALLNEPSSLALNTKSSLSKTTVTPLAV